MRAPLPTPCSVDFAYLHQQGEPKILVLRNEDFSFVCAGHNVILSVARASFPIRATQMNEVALRANDVTLRVNDVGLRPMMLRLTP